MIIVISGKKRAGKDTVAKMISERFPDKFVEIAFADPIKEMLESACRSSGSIVLRSLDFWKGDREKPIAIGNQEVVTLMERLVKGIESKTGKSPRGWNDGYHVVVEGIENNVEPWTVRRLMQLFGTDIVCNCIDNYIWVGLALERAAKSKKEHVIIKDCRQEHEYKYMKVLNAKFIFVEKDNDQIDKHSTEKGLTPAMDDYIIVNNGTVEELQTAVNNIKFKF